MIIVNSAGGIRHGKATYSDHVGGDVANTTGPALRGLVQDVVHAEAAVLLGESIEVLLEENVLGRDVGEDEVDLGLVACGTATDDGADDLEHGGDTGTSGDHAKVTDHVRGVDEGTLGTLDLERLANLERGHVLGDVAGGVGLDQEVKVAGLVVARDGGVGAHDLLGGAIGLGAVGADGDVLADGKAKNTLLGGEAEPVAKEAVNYMAQLRAIAATYMAVLWERMVFSLSSKSWKASGLRTFLISARGRVSEAIPSSSERARTYA